MKAVVVVLNYNDAERCISVAENAIATGYIEKAIVVDNCSPDNSINYLRQHETGKIIVLQSDKNGGYAYGHNVGLRYAVSKMHPDIIFTINSDIIFDKDVIKKCIDFLERNKDFGLVSAMMLNRNKEYDGGYWFAPEYSYLLKRCFWLYRKRHLDTAMPMPEETVTEVDAVRGSFLCFSAEALKKVDFFDENTFLYYEENIIGAKLKRAGYKVGFLTNCSYVHNHKFNGKTIRRNLRNEFHSMLHYADTYMDIGSMQKKLLHICAWYGIAEQDMLSSIKVKLHQLKK